MLKFSFKKMALGGVFLLCIFAVGFAGGLFFSSMAAGRGEKIPKASVTKAFPIFDLGEFKLSLPGGKFTDPILVSFELVLELQDQKVLDVLNSDEYWKALFRNEVISESLSEGQDAFRTPEGLLNLSESITTRLNGVGPTMPKISGPIRRVLLKSFVTQ